MKKAIVLITCLLVAMLILISGSSLACSKSTPTPATTQPVNPVAEPITLVFSTHEFSDGVLAQRILKPYLAELEKRAQGRLKIEAHWNGELVAMYDAYDAVATGQMDMASFSPPTSVGMFPIDDVNVFAQQNTHCWKPSRVYFELQQKFPEMLAQYEDTHIIAPYVMYMRGLATTKKPINTLEDFKGLKGLSNGRWGGRLMEVLGMTPVTVSFQDQFSSLEKGVIDAEWMVNFTLEDFHFGEVFNYIVEMATPQVTQAIAVNLKTWNSLPADIQKIIDDTTADYWIDMVDREQVLIDKERGQEALTKFPNIKWTKLSNDDLDKMAQMQRPVLEEWATEINSKGLPGNDIRDEFLRLDAKYSAPEYEPK
ncbi:MAG: TRAP transporter substrate-binding protein DctP [Dehalococcoidales bacterium]|nr:TRAP transporter substrate-binding protein DctP [Dehalococcoidales bacterium]